MRFYIRAMQRHWRQRSVWFTAVKPQDLRKVLGLLRSNGALTIRDIDDDVLVEKDHLWASRKPSKRALQLAFYRGLVTVSRRSGMLKTYELTTRHFGWDRLPKAASEREILEYRIDRALRSQGVVSLDSICYLAAGLKPGVRRLIEARVRRGELVPVALDGAGKQEHWAAPATLDDSLWPGAEPGTGLVHILSPFDPLVRERKRLALFFGYDHRFEAYVPKDKRVYGYFACPVLIDDAIVAALDLKTDREKRKLVVQQWTWLGDGARRQRKRQIEEALHRFERFQLGR
jgi:uncharacterized protein YcaQ